MEQNLILCALETLNETKTYAVKKVFWTSNVITGLLLLCMQCVSNGRYLSCSSWLRKASSAVAKPKDSFPRHILVNTSSQLISVEVWVSEGGEYEEK
jgi:hypothetical protein